MSRIPVVAAAMAAAVFSPPGFAQTHPRCAQSADRAAVAAVERTPAIGQTFVSGIPFEVRPGVLRVEVQVFGGNPSYEYLVDVKLDGACGVLGTSIRLENNPWYDFR